MRHMALAALLLLTLTSATAGQDTTYTRSGNHLLESCQKAVRYFDSNGGPAGEVYDAGWCVGWVASLLEQSQLSGQWRTVTEAKPALLEFCLPADGIPVVQGIRIVVKYLKDNPGQLHENAMTLTILAFKNSFPCSR